MVDDIQQPSSDEDTRTATVRDNSDTENTPSAVEQSLSLSSESQVEASPTPLEESPSPQSYEDHVEPPPDPLDENGHRYVGLINQAMTCYLNSLIQSLYMTPELRNAIYDWEPPSGSMEDTEGSILYQIQKLFCLLQTIEIKDIETLDLTAAFGWANNEEYDQHDVQEFRRLLLDEIERLWKGTRHEKLIENLYRGTMQDVVKCLSCGKENIKEDYFLDLPLALKSFEGNATYGSIEESLNAFIASEKLYGSDQYYCEHCGGKKDAEKGLRITHFPRLLTMQLKRFDFDYNTMHKFKLNDRMTFPDILNLNPFVYRSDQVEIEIHREDIDEVDEMPIVGQPIRKEMVDSLLQQGEYVYELYSIMVHQGSTNAGHYFAYIKNLEQDRWYIFNDSCVEFATSEEIIDTFGGFFGRNNPNSYMLMYRKVQDDNELFMRTDHLPTHVVQRKGLWIHAEVGRYTQRQREANLAKTHVYIQQVDHNVAAQAYRAAYSDQKCENHWELLTHTIAEATDIPFEYIGILHPDNWSRINGNGIISTRLYNRSYMRKMDLPSCFVEMLPKLAVTFVDRRPH